MLDNVEATPSRDRFEAQVDPDGTLPEAERLRRGRGGPAGLVRRDGLPVGQGPPAAPGGPATALSAQGVDRLVESIRSSFEQAWQHYEDGCALLVEAHQGLPAFEPADEHPALTMGLEAPDHTVAARDRAADGQHRAVAGRRRRMSRARPAGGLVPGPLGGRCRCSTHPERRSQPVRVVAHTLSPCDSFRAASWARCTWAERA